MYFGSIRFYKHLFAVVLSLLALIPLVICVILAVQNHNYRVQLGLLRAEQPLSGWSAQAAEYTGSPAGQKPETPSYQGLYPQLYAQPAARATDKTSKTVYLTFDDGPSEQTEQLLTCLASARVKATFFVTGRTDEASVRRLREIAGAGHTLGMHSYSHDYQKIYASVEDFLADYDQLYRLIFDATGIYPQVFRFPGGSINTYNAPLYQEIIAEMTRRGFVYFDWNLNAADATGEPVTAAEIAETVLGGLDGLDRAFVLLHDSAGKGATTEALPAILEGCRAKGYRLAPLTPEVVPLVFAYVE